MSEDMILTQENKTVQNTENIGDKNTSLAAEQNSFEEEKLFTQSQLKELISERLKRERKVNEALIPVKELLNTLVKEGALKQGSYSNMAKELSEALKRARGENECSEENGKAVGSFTDEGENTASKTGGDDITAFADVVDEVSERNEGGSADAAENAGLQGADFFASLKEISEKYPEDKVENLFTLGLFEKFAKGKSGNICDIYGDYRNFLKTVEDLKGKSVYTNEPKEEYKSDEEYESTSFSRFSGSAQDCSLTKQQMEIARSAGISYREYEELLRSVPKSTRRVNY